MARRFSTREGGALPDFPASDDRHLRLPDLDALRPPISTHPPRILILYGSLRPVSYSRLLAQEAGRLLEHFGAEVRFFDPSGLPLPDDSPAGH
ncbi:MAG: NAD(P)H-dependent oxidoreductase, partial [Rhizobium sp.]|nr:NAD(P)H-dependent oxidoreductase [Rhizobium sp.]